MIGLRWRRECVINHTEKGLRMWVRVRVRVRVRVKVRIRVRVRDRISRWLRSKRLC